jgi:hypothetical protein
MYFLNPSGRDAMVELLLKLLDKLKELYEVQDRRQERIFEKLIEPIYKELQLIHEDYMESMHKLQQMMPQSDNDADSLLSRQRALEYLKERRNKLQPARAKLETYSIDFPDDSPKIQTDSQRFLLAVTAYLNRAVLGFGRTRYTALIEYLSGRDGVLPFYLDAPKSEACSADFFVKEMTADCEQSWKKVSAVFTSIQVKTLTH